MNNNTNVKIRQFMSKYLYSMLVALIVWIALVLMPMFNTDGMVGFQIPDSTLGRCAYFLIRGLVAVLVFMIFVLFDMQGKTNVLEDPKYLEAYNLLNTIENKEYVPISPAKYKAKTYGFKAVTLSVTTAVSACVIMEMVLTYNWSLLASYGLSILTALINGLIQMKKAEIYWTEEYLKYAHYAKAHETKTKGKKKHVSVQQQRVQELAGTSSKE